MRPSKVVQLPGQGEGQQEVRYRKQLQALAFTPSGMTMLVALTVGRPDGRRREGDGPALLV